MPPTIGSLFPKLDLLSQVANNTRNSTITDLGAYAEKKWSRVNVASVDLIAMVVSDAGLANTEPQWWNASPNGCILLGLQPRGGWQVLQRAVQWGSDHWAHCFGVSCKVPITYAYFACSIRNRIEVWNSKNFISPMQDEVDANSEPVKPFVKDFDLKSSADEVVSDSAGADSKTLGLIPRLTEETITVTSTVSPNIKPKDGTDAVTKRRTNSSQNRQAHKSETHQDTSWNRIDRGKAGFFEVMRPTKLIDGSRGGQAFMCDILRPEPGRAYGLEEQARLQMLSVLLVAAGLTESDQYADFLRTAQDDFGLNPHLGVIFKRLMAFLLVTNAIVLGFAVSLCYAIWLHNVYGDAIPYLIQLCSIMSWASGAIGLLALGGNPRVTIDQSKPPPVHILARLDAVKDEFATLKFGSLHGSSYLQDQGSCPVATDVVRAVCRWRIKLTRSWGWLFGMTWFASFLFLSIVLQIAASKVSTVKSEIMSIVLLLLTSVLRGAGLSGPETWMIPQWRQRPGTRHAVSLVGQVMARASVGGT